MFKKPVDAGQEGDDSVGTNTPSVSKVKVCCVCGESDKSVMRCSKCCRGTTSDVWYEGLVEAAVPLSAN